MKISQVIKSRLSDTEGGRQAGRQIKKYFRQYARKSRKDIVFLHTLNITLSKTGARLDWGLHARKGFVLEKVHSIVWRTIRKVRARIRYDKLKMATTQLEFPYTLLRTEASLFGWPFRGDENANGPPFLSIIKYGNKIQFGTVSKATSDFLSESYQCIGS